MPIEGITDSPQDPTTTIDYIIVDEEGRFLEGDGRALLSWQDPNFPTNAQYEYLGTGTFPRGNPTGPTSVSYGVESPTRQLLLVHAGTYWPEGTVAQEFTSPITTAHRYSKRAADGAFLSNSFPSYTNRDGTLLSGIVPTGTSGDLIMSHGSGLEYGATGGSGGYWLVGLSKLNTTDSPHYQVGTSTNDVVVTIPPGGVLTTLFSNDSSSATMNFGDKLGGNVRTANYDWQLWAYRNESGFSESKTITITGTVLRHIIASVWA